MPIETRLFVKTSLLWLCATFALGASMLAAKTLTISLPYDFSAVHAHMGFVGWLVNLVMGIALWFLPANREKFPANRGRYPAPTVRWIYAMLNVGLILRVVFEPALDKSGPTTLLSGIILVSVILQLAAIVLFATIAWARVRAV